MTPGTVELGLTINAPHKLPSLARVMCNRGTPLLPEEGCHEVTGWWEETCLRTSESANARRDAARQARRGGVSRFTIHESRFTAFEPPMPVLSLSKGTPIHADKFKPRDQE
jgi:hypothetical protein